MKYILNSYLIGVFFFVLSKKIIINSPNCVTFGKWNLEENKKLENNTYQDIFRIFSKIESYLIFFAQFCSSNTGCIDVLYTKIPI